MFAQNLSSLTHQHDERKTNTWALHYYKDKIVSSLQQREHQENAIIFTVKDSNTICIVNLS